MLTTAQLSFEPARTAMLCMDYQTGIVSIYAQAQTDMLMRAADLLKQARLCGLTVIYVQVGFRPNLPEIGMRNLLFSAIKSSPRHQLLFTGPAAAIHSAVAPETGDIIVTKHRVSAFTGTDLELILRANQIDTLILFGIATSGVVLSTLCHAADADYRLVVIKDCCADLDAAVHHCLVEKIFPRSSVVASARECLDVLQ
jgi:nicotinamidase-related amidase